MYKITRENNGDLTIYEIDVNHIVYLKKYRSGENEPIEYSIMMTSGEVIKLYPAEYFDLSHIKAKVAGFSSE